MFTSLRYWVLASLLIALFGFTQAYAGSDASQLNTRTVASGAGDVAPDFTATDVITDQNIILSDYKGSVVVLNFVNYGCSSSIRNNILER